jgi:ELWxxDGT repeat protein
LNATAEVIELNLSGFGVRPSEIAAIGRTIYFAGTDPAGGRELWRSDGTAGGTRRLKDVMPGPYSSDPHSLIDVGGRLFFIADGGSGDELWTSDGTEAGTHLVKEINPGFNGPWFPFPGYPEPEPLGAFIDEMTAVNGTLFFRANDGVNGYALWKSDGTQAGTVMVKDLGPTASDLSLDLYQFVDWNGTLLFRNAEEEQLDLWRSDGTPEGTVRVKPLPYISAAGMPYGLSPLIGVVGDELRFFSGSVLWRSDGTEEGTQPIIDVGRIALDAATAGGVTYFRTAINSSQTLRAELWRTDGTVGGTWRLISSWQDPAQFTPVGDALYFTSGYPCDARQLWRTDGTVAGTVLIADAAQLSPGSSDTFSSLTAVGGRLTFTLGDTQEGTLWTTDGTDSGTAQVLPIGGRLNASMNSLVSAGSVLYFAGNDGFTGLELWTTDGTSVGTVRIADGVSGSQGSNPKHFVELAGRAIFFANNDQLWTSDGTLAGTQLVADLDWPTIYGVERTVFGGFAYFIVTTAAQRELWRTDGTAAGTTMLKSAQGSAPNGFPALANLTVVGGTLYFTAYASEQLSTSLWKIEESQGSPAEVTAPGTLSRISTLVALGDTLMFAGYDSQAGGELWRSDGTASGTQRVANIHPTGNAFVPDFIYYYGDWSHQLTVVGDVLYFPADDGSSGKELWRSNGTATGTRRVKDLTSGAGGSLPTGLLSLGGFLYFQTSEGPYAGATWRSDGTEAGTVPLDGVVISPGVSDGRGGVYFDWYDAEKGSTLWRSDGTAAGTWLVVDRKPDADYSYSDYYNLILVGDSLYFIADDEVHGHALWQSDGTETGTVMMHVVDPGGFNGHFKEFTVLGNTLLGAGYDGSAFELWTLRPEGAAPTGGDFNHDTRIDGSDFLAWQRQLGSMTLDADANQNGIVDAADLAYWKNGISWVPEESAEEMNVALAAVRVADEGERDAAFDAIAVASLAGWSSRGLFTNDEVRESDKQFRISNSAGSDTRAHVLLMTRDASRADGSIPTRASVADGEVKRKALGGLNAGLAAHKLEMTYMWEDRTKVS